MYPLSYRPVQAKSKLVSEMSEKERQLEGTLASLTEQLNRERETTSHERSQVSLAFDLRPARSFSSQQSCGDEKGRTQRSARPRDQTPAHIQGCR